jgi:hypothetical protein
MFGRAQICKRLTSPGIDSDFKLPVLKILHFSNRLHYTVVSKQHINYLGSSTLGEITANKNLNARLSLS